MKSVLFGIVLTLGLVGPVMANPVHGDLTAGSIFERVNANDNTNASSINLHLSNKVNQKEDVYVNLAGSYVSHNGDVFNSNHYSALSGSLGGNYHLNSLTYVNLELGNKVHVVGGNLGNGNITIPFINIAVTKRLF